VVSLSGRCSWTGITLEIFINPFVWLIEDDRFTQVTVAIHANKSLVILIVYCRAERAF
jgi:hypothetical protein